MKKLIRDHVSMSDNNGRVVADFDENILRSWRPTYWGCQSFNLYDHENSGRRILSGIQESYWTSWWRGERQGFEFTSADGVQYVSRKVHTVTEGMNKVRHGTRWMAVGTAWYAVDGRSPLSLPAPASRSYLAHS